MPTERCRQVVILPPESVGFGGIFFCEVYVEELHCPAPLYRDPVHDGATDPMVIWNHQEKAWWMVYTSRRADSPVKGLKHAWVHGTDLGAASSTDGGQTWLYRGTLSLEPFEPGHNTYWAPEILYHEGTYHMYVSFVRGIPTDWEGDRVIVHYTSTDFWKWKCHGELVLSSRRVIDAGIVRSRSGQWLLYYKDEDHSSQTWAASSDDLEHWMVVGPVVTDRGHEGPNVFWFQGWYWMLTDPWNGIGVYRSEDALKWEFQSIILGEPGTRPMDNHLAHHPDVVVNGERAYVFYFVHPSQIVPWGSPGSDEPAWRTSVVQAAELQVSEGRLTCDRNRDFHLELTPET